jgi:hypothetical protein
MLLHLAEEFYMEKQHHGAVSSWCHYSFSMLANLALYMKVVY